MFEEIFRCDERILLMVNKQHNRKADKLMWFVSERLNKIPYMLAIAVLIRMLFRKRSPYLLLAVLLCVMLVSEVAAMAVKIIVRRKRPFRNYAIGGKVRIINDYRLPDHSFYSSHASGFFALSAFLSGITSCRLLRMILYGCAGLTAYSRMYLGQHFPLDVLAGSLAGIAIGKNGKKLFVRLAGNAKNLK